MFVLIDDKLTFVGSFFHFSGFIYYLHCVLLQETNDNHHPHFIDFAEHCRLTPHYGVSYYYIIYSLSSQLFLTNFFFVFIRNIPFFSRQHLSIIIYIYGETIYINPARLTQKCNRFIFTKK